AALGIEVVEDPTNVDARFTRNRVRHEVLPLLSEVAGRDVVPLLCRTAELAAEQADLLDDLAGGLDPTDARALAAAPRPLATAALRRWWTEVTGTGHPPDAAAVRRMLDVVAGRAVGCDVAGGWSLRRTEGRLRLVRTSRGCDRAGGGQRRPRMLGDAGGRCAARRGAAGSSAPPVVATARTGSNVGRGGSTTRTTSGPSSDSPPTTGSARCS